MSEKSRVSSFGPYLEAMREREESAKRAPKVSPLSLLAILAAAPKAELTIPELQALSRLEFTAFSDAFKGLVMARFIETFGEPGAELVRLTTRGAEVAALSRPA